MSLYLLFRGATYYPAPGVEDLASVHTTLEDAKAACPPIDLDYQWAQIVEIDGDKVRFMLEWWDEHGWIAADSDWTAARPIAWVP